ncbi:hypothetical protein LSH36_259g04062, partial [Paralvinella palmiformis]
DTFTCERVSACVPACLIIFLCVICCKNVRSFPTSGLLEPSKIARSRFPVNRWGVNFTRHLDQYHVQYEVKDKV